MLFFNLHIYGENRHFNEMMITMYVLYYPHTRTHYHDSKPITLCSYSLVQHG